MSANGLADRVHRRQFVLGPRPAPVAGWVSKRVSDALVLSHCPDLPVASAVARACICAATRAGVAVPP